MFPVWEIETVPILSHRAWGKAMYWHEKLGEIWQTSQTVQSILLLIVQVYV